MDMDIRDAIIEQLASLDTTDRDAIIAAAEKMIAVVRKDTVEDVLIEIDEMDATDTSMQVYEMIHSNF